MKEAKHKKATMMIKVYFFFIDVLSKIVEKLRQLWILKAVLTL